MERLDQHRLDQRLSVIDHEMLSVTVGDADYDGTGVAQKEPHQTGSRAPLEQKVRILEETIQASDSVVRAQASQLRTLSEKCDQLVATVTSLGERNDRLEASLGTLTLEMKTKSEDKAKGVTVSANFTSQSTSAPGLGEQAREAQPIRQWIHSVLQKANHFGTPKGRTGAVNYYGTDVFHPVGAPVEESIWTTPLLLFMPAVGSYASAYTLLLVMINIVVQLTFTLIVATTLTNSPFTEQANQEFRQWRRRIAHDVSYMSSTGTSLASRVCTRSTSLTVGSTQADAYQDTAAYLQNVSGTIAVAAGPVSFRKQTRTSLALLRTSSTLPSRLALDSALYWTSTRSLCASCLHTQRAVHTTFLLYTQSQHTAITPQIVTLFVRRCASWRSPSGR